MNSKLNLHEARSIHREVPVLICAPENATLLVCITFRSNATAVYLQAAHACKQHMAAKTANPLWAWLR